MKNHDERFRLLFILSHINSTIAIFIFVVGTERFELPALSL